MVNAGSAEDDLFTLIELIEDAIRNNLTLQALVASCYAGKVRREHSVQGEDNYWHANAIIEVSIIKKVS